MIKCFKVCQKQCFDDKFLQFRKQLFLNIPGDCDIFLTNIGELEVIKYLVNNQASLGPLGKLARRVVVMRMIIMRGWVLKMIRMALTIMVMTTMAMFGRYSGLSKPLRASCMATEARGQQNNRRLCNTNKPCLFAPEFDKIVNTNIFHSYTWFQMD